MLARSAKNKGDRFEHYLVKILRETVDEKTSRTVGSGNGLDKSDLRIPSKNWEIEAKNAKQIHLIDDWEQTKRQNTFGNRTALAIRNPKKPEFEEVLIVISLDDFINFLNKEGGEISIINNKDNELKYAVRNLKEACSKVIKKLE